MAVNWWACHDSEDPRIGAEEVAVYAVLVRHANGDGTCYPAYPRLCRQSHLCINAVRNALAALDEAGIIERTHGSKQNPRGYTYRLPMGDATTTHSPSEVSRRDMSSGDMSGGDMSSGGGRGITSCYPEVSPGATKLLHGTTPSTTPLSCGADSLDLDLQPPPEKPTTADADFAEWRAAFGPNLHQRSRDNWKEARKEWDALRKRKVPAADILLVTRYLLKIDTKWDTGEFRPAAARFLKAGHAEDPDTMEAARQWRESPVRTSTFEKIARAPR